MYERADELGMPLDAKEVEALARKVGRPRRVKITVDMQRVRELLDAGFSHRQVAELLDVGRTTIYRRISEADYGYCRY